MPRHTTHDDEPTPPDAPAVATQVDRMLASRDFDAGSRGRALFRFLAEETIAGRGERLTEGAIAAHVFGRGGDFDPALDPIVRLQVGRLRRSLARFHRGAGAADPVHIELPRGTYVLAASKNEAVRHPETAASSRRAREPSLLTRA
jgi:hypothetical protein